jgi:GT2 family glycosyltransferase
MESFDVSWDERTVMDTHARSSQARVTVVIPVHNRRQITLDCLRCLEEVKHGGFELNVTVVDDGSTDGTADAIAASYARTRVLKGDGTLWWSGAMNLGVADALERGSDYIFSLNDDTLFDADMISGLLNDAESKADCLWAPWGVATDDGQLLSKGYCFVAGKGWTQPQNVDLATNAPYQVEGLSGACVLIPAAVFRAIGFYEAKRLPQYHADLEFTVRAHRRGFQTWIDPRLKLRIHRNQKNTDLLRDKLNLKSIYHMFSWPRGIYAPGAIFAFYEMTHPKGVWGGRFHALGFYCKTIVKITLNLLGLNRYFR